MSEKNYRDLAQQHGMDYDDVKQRGLSDDDIEWYISNKSNFATPKEVMEQPTAQPMDQPKRTFLGSLGDVGVTALKGAVDIGQSMQGLADIPTGGRVGKFTDEVLGYRPQETKSILNSWQSDAQKFAQSKVDNAEGFVDTTKEYIKNPSTIATAAGESLPSMFAGAGMGGKVVKYAPKLLKFSPAAVKTVEKYAPVLAGAIGEGLISMGSTEESIRNQTENGLTTMKQGGSAVMSGIGTGLFSLAGGRLAQKLGFDDVDTFFAKLTMDTGEKVVKTPRAVVARILGGGISESVFEEMPQSGQEQVWMNAALDKPLLEDVPEAMASGGVVGFAMGGGFNAVSGMAGVPKDTYENNLNERFDSIMLQGPDKVPAAITLLSQKIADTNQALQQKETLEALAAEADMDVTDLEQLLIQDNQANQDLITRLEEAVPTPQVQEDQPVQEVQPETVPTQKQNESPFVATPQTPDNEKQAMYEELFGTITTDGVDGTAQASAEVFDQQPEILNEDGQPFQTYDELAAQIAVLPDPSEYQIIQTPEGFIGTKKVSAERDSSTFKSEQQVGQASQVKQAGIDNDKIALEEGLNRQGALVPQTTQNTLRDATGAYQGQPTTTLTGQTPQTQQNMINLEEQLQVNTQQLDALVTQLKTTTDPQERLALQQEGAVIYETKEKLQAQWDAKYQEQLQSQGTLAEPNAENANFLPEFQTTEQDFVKDYQGTAIIGFHGTASKPFNSFDDSRVQEFEHGWSGAGHYFTTKKDYAKSYADMGEFSKDSPGRIAQARFTFKNPIYKNSPEYNDILLSAIGSTSIMTNKEGTAVTKALKEAGYDAVISGKDIESALEINVFDSKNIHYAPGQTEFQTAEQQFKKSNPWVVIEHAYGDWTISKDFKTKKDAERYYGQGNVKRDAHGTYEIKEDDTAHLIMRKNDLAASGYSLPEFQTTYSAKASQVSLSEIESMFPNQQVIQDTDGTINVRFKNGKGVTIKSMQDAGQGFIKLAIETGQMSENGKILGITIDSDILLDSNFADNKTMWHENKHVLDNLGMVTKEDDSALNAEFNRLRKANKLDFALSTHKDPIQRMKENRANMFAQIMTGREAYRANSKFKAMIQRVMDFFQQILTVGKQSISGLARDVETGKLYERQVNESTKEASLTQFQATDMEYSVADQVLAGLISQKTETNTPEFDEWFGKSTAKTSDGSPLVFYHGTDGVFDTFKQDASSNTEHASAGLGHFFTLQKELAGRYGQHVLPVYLKMDKPYLMSLPEAQSFKTVEESTKRQEELKAEGYDSILIKTGDSPYIVTFESGQSKSIHNQGQWKDPSNIYFETREQASDAFDDIANEQRGKPEEAMIDVQMASGGGVLNPIVEHAGDLIHRMTQRPDFFHGGFEYVNDKVQKLSRWLNDPYGFEREHEENIRANVSYKKIPEALLRENIDKTLKAFGDAHAELPAYNEAHQLANNLNIAIGNQQWDKARSILATLKSHVDQGEKHWKEFSLQNYDPEQNKTINDINSPAGKKWFKGSKVVDNDGKPLIVYHGTKSEKVFNSFDPNALRDDNRRTAIDSGIHFTTDPKFASRMSFAPFPINEKPRIYPTYLNVQKLWQHDDPQAINDFTLAYQQKYGVSPREAILEKAKKGHWFALEGITEILASMGYDGIKVNENNTTNYIVFKPTQVKSVFNREWNKQNPQFQISEPAEQKLTDNQYVKRFNQKNNLIQSIMQTSRIRGKELLQLADKSFGAISTRLGNANVMLKHKMRRLDFDTSQKIIEALRVAKPLLDATKEMSAQDRHTWDLARKQADTVKINQIATKYNMLEDQEKLREVMNKLRQDAIDVGYQVGFIEEYWPRIIKDTEGFLQAFYADKKLSDRPIFTDALNAKAKKMGITLETLNRDFPEVKADIISNMILGQGTGMGGPGNIQSRKFDTIPDGFEKFYMNSDSALMQYIYSMTKKIEARKFFGKVPPKIQAHKNAITKAQVDLNGVELSLEQSKDNAEVTEILQNRADELNDQITLHNEALDKYKEQRDYTENIGAYIDELMLTGKLHKKDEKVVKEILEARFNEHGTTGVMNAYKNLAYIDVMGNPLSALTQIGDLAWAAYVGKVWTPKGFSNTVQNLIKATLGKSKMTKEDLGLERIAQEFADGTTLGNAVSKVFSAVGLTKMDSIGKEVLINNALQGYQEQIKTDEGRKALAKKIRPIFGKKTDQVITDLGTGEHSDNVKMLVYSRLLDFQPAALSEMPEFYLKGGNGRIFYMLKTYTLKQMDVFRNEIFQELQSKDHKRIAQGMKNMVGLLSMLTLANAGADELKDFVLGKETRFKDNVIDSFLTLGGVSRYKRMQITRDGLGTSLVKQILPPMKLVNSVWADASEKINKGELEKGFRSLDSVPGIGKLAYWHIGRGSENKKTLFEKDFSEASKRFKKFNKKSEKSPDQRLFFQTNSDEFKQMKLHQNFSSALNGNKATINKLKKLEQTPNVIKRIDQLEKQRKLFYAKYFKASENLAK